MLILIGVANEDGGILGIGSDGEGENVSSDEVLTPTVTLRNNKLSQSQVSKRLSLPANVQLPDYFLERISPSLEQPMSRRLRRASLVNAS